MKKIFIIVFLLFLRITTNGQNIYKPLEKEPQTDFFILNQKQVEEIFNKEPKNFIIELPTSNLTTKKFNVKISNFKSKDFKIKDSNGNLIKTDKNTIGLIYDLLDAETNENQGIFGIKKNQIDVEIQLKRNYISIHEFDTTRKYKVTFGEIDKAFKNIKKKIEDSKILYASNDKEIVLRDLVKTEESLFPPTFCSKPAITTTQSTYTFGDSLSLSIIKLVSPGSTNDANLLYYNFIYPNGDTTSLNEFIGEELTLPVRNNLTLADSGWYYVRFRQNGCPTMLDSIFIIINDTNTISNRPPSTNEFIGNSGGNLSCKRLVINFDISYDYYKRCNMDASKAVYKVTYVFNFVKRIFDEIAIPLKLGDIRVSTAPEGLSGLDAFNREGQFNVFREYCENAFQKFWCNANQPFNGIVPCLYPSEFRYSNPDGVFATGKSILWEWKSLMYTNNSNTVQWEQLNDETAEVCFLVIDKTYNNYINNEYYVQGGGSIGTFGGNRYSNNDSYKSVLPNKVTPHINLFSNFKNKVDKFTGCYAKFIGCSQHRGLLLNNTVAHPYFQSFTSVNYKDLLRTNSGADFDFPNVNIGVEGVNITNIGILPFFGDSALPTNVTENDWKRYIYATDNGNGTVVMPDGAEFRWRTTEPTNNISSNFIVNKNNYRQINTHYPMFNTLNANAYMLIYNLCNLLGVEANTNKHKNIFNSILSPLVDVNNTRSISSPDLIARDYTVPPPYKANSAPDFISWGKGFLNNEIEYMRGIFNNPPNGYLTRLNNGKSIPYSKILTTNKNYVVGDILKLTTNQNSSNKNFDWQVYNWYTTQDMYDFTNNLPSATIPTTYRWRGPNNYTSTNRENDITLNYNNAQYGGVEFRDYYLQKYYTEDGSTCSSNVAKIKIKIYPYKGIPNSENFIDWEDVSALSGNIKFKWALRNWDFIGPFSGTDFETDYIESRRSIGNRIGGLITRKFGTFNTLNESTFISGTGWTNPKSFIPISNWNGLMYQARTHPYERNALASNPSYCEWPNDAYDGWYARTYDITEYTFPWNYFNIAGNPNEYVIGVKPRNLDLFRDMNQQNGYGGSRVTVRYPTLAGYDFWRKGKADTARSPIYVNNIQGNGLALIFDYSHVVGQYNFFKIINRTEGINDYASGNAAGINGQIDGQWNSGHLIGDYEYAYNTVPTPDMFDSLMIYAYFSRGTTPKLIYKKSSKDLSTLPAQTGYKREYIPDAIYNPLQWGREWINLNIYDTCSRVQFDFIIKNGNSIYSASNNFYIKDINIVRSLIKKPSLIPDSLSGVNGITRCDSLATWTVSLPENHNVNQVRVDAYKFNESTALYELIGAVTTLNTPNLTNAYSTTINLRYKNYMVTRPDGGEFRSPVYFRATAINSLVGNMVSDMVALINDCNVGQILRPTFTATGPSAGSVDNTRIFFNGNGSIEFTLPTNHRGKYVRLYAKTTSGFAGGPFVGGYSDILKPLNSAPLITLPNYNARTIKFNFGITSSGQYTYNLPSLPSQQGGLNNARYEFYLFSFNNPKFADFTKCCSNVDFTNITSLLGQTGNFPNFYNNSNAQRIINCDGTVGCTIPPDVTSDPAESTTGNFTIKIQYPSDHNAIKYNLYESTTSNSNGNVIATAAIPNLYFPFLFTHQISGKPNGVYFYRVETTYKNNQKVYSNPLSVKVQNPNAVICAPTSVQVINSTRSKFEYKFTLSNNCEVPNGYKATFYKCNNNSANGLLATNPNLSTDQVKQLPLGLGYVKNVSNDITSNITLKQQEITQKFFQRTVTPALSIGNCWYRIDVTCTKCPTPNKTTTIYTYVTNN